MSKVPYRLKESFLSLERDEMDKAVWSAFELESEIQWRWPEPGREYITVQLMALFPSGWNILDSGETPGPMFL